MKENNKFVMGEDEATKPTTEAISASPSTITTTANVQHKRPVRHHVKRRSSGRVHVAKLAPMVRANSSNHTDTEADYYDDPNSTAEYTRPTMKRSQSQRSLHKMSFDRKGFGNLTAVRRKSTASTASDKMSVSEIVPATKAVETTKALSSNPASLSSSNIAEPVEITINAVANNLVIPKKELLPTIASPLKSSTHYHSNSSNPELAETQQAHSPTTNTTNTTKKQLLRSQFVNSPYEEPIMTLTSNKRPTTVSSSTPFNHNRSNSSSSNMTNVSRTQQKLLLQKQQALVEDENSPVHPRNMHKLNREFDMVGREYRCIKRYEDPMRVSLMRCIERLDSLPPPSASSPPPLSQKPANPQVARLQLGANQHSMSTSIVPTISSAVTAAAAAAAAAAATPNTNTNIPHLEQRQIAHRHHHLKSIALSRTTKNYKRQSTAAPNAALDSGSKQTSNNQGGGNVFTGFPWNAAAIIDRIFSNSPQQH